MGATTGIAAGPLVLEERSGRVVTLRLNRPEKLNALNPPMVQELVHALLRASDDRSLRAVVITGAGRGFCSGGDIHYIHQARTSKSTHDFEVLLNLGKELILAIATMPKPVIAAVNGPAAGGGMSLALACDLRIASDQAMFKQAFAQLGLYPDLGATFFLPRFVGLSRASEYFYTSERLSAEEARRIGMVYAIYPHDQFDVEVKKFAEQMAAAPPLAYRDVKRTMISEAHRALEEAITEENRLQVHCFLSEDCAEGLSAFLEKRPPKFRGH
ncbi:MAG TPA: enoyl-CoA hydratase [Candidatus Acidoferrales bacterium]|nr:enoyl-CoA hydratase [Candidatus Acidoferrales bacterium]